MKCIKCQNEVSDDAKFCTRCGFKFSDAQPVHMEAPRTQVCSKCGNPLQAGMKFCTSCGTPVGSAPVPTPTPSPVSLSGNSQPSINEAEADEETAVLDEAEADEETAVLDEAEADEETAVLDEAEADEETAVLDEAEADEETTVLDEMQTQPQQPTYQQQTQYQQPVYQQQAQPQQTMYQQQAQPQQTMYQQRAQYQQPQQQPQPQQIRQPMPVKTSTKKEKKGGKGLAVAVIIILVLVVAAIAVWLLIKNDKIHLPSSLGKTDEDTTSEEMIDGENEDENEDESATDDATETDEAEVEELIADADDAVESAKSMLDDDSQVVDAMSQIRSAMDEYLEKSSEVGYSSVIEEHINDAYGTYVNGMSRRVDYMSTQTLSGGIYSQLMSEINDVIGYADTISAAGYSIDTTEITTLRDTFDTDYRTKIIETFNEFSTRDAWSRTEAWNLMSETDSMFDADDFDNPIKLRYEYALAYWTQKQIETDLASGTITAKGAAVKIGNILEATDYNLMLIYEYINFMDEAGEDYSAVSDAYYEALYQIYDTQGIDLTSDIDIYKFWSFNSFDDYSSSVGDGDVNGLTNENRTYIRELFQGVSFVN